MLKKILCLMLICILCGSFVFAACADENTEETVDSGIYDYSGFGDKEAVEAMKKKLRAQYGENKQITDGNYDKSLAVKCINGTFVGKKTDGIIAYKGIPFVGVQPVGEHRWKAPVDYTEDDGVYEAYYNGKSPRQHETGDEDASLYVQGEDCLYLNIWKAEDDSEEKKPVMVWIHGGAFEMGGTVDPLYEAHREPGCHCRIHRVQGWGIRILPSVPPAGWTGLSGRTESGPHGSDDGIEMDS